jgi:hypothetical protein
MKLFARIDETNVVIDVYVAENLDAIKSVISGTIIEVLEEQSASPGYTYDRSSSLFYPPKPYDSWILDENGKWVSPVTKPDDPNVLWVWKEDTLSWYNDGDARPYPSWTWDSESGMFQPPIPHPTGLGTGNYKWDEENQTWNLDSSWQKYPSS